MSDKIEITIYCRDCGVTLDPQPPLAANWTPPSRCTRCDLLSRFTGPVTFYRPPPPGAAQVAVNAVNPRRMETQ